MSALTNELGYPGWAGDHVLLGGNGPAAFQTTLLMDASGESVAFVGYVWHPTVKTGTINIRKVHFRCGAVTLNVLSTFTVSLQDVSATAGAPYQPDGTQDQTANMTLTANAWNTTGNLSADRAVNLSVYGPGAANSRMLAVVFTNTFTALDSIIISSLSTLGNQNPFNLIGGAGILNTGTWAAVNLTSPILAFECDDGTFAFMEGAFPISALGSATTANNASLRAIGVRYTVPTTRKIDRAGLVVQIPNGCDGALEIYQSGNNTPLVSVTIDNDAVIVANTQRYAVANFQPIEQVANTVYRLVYTPSTVTAATVPHFDVNAAGLMDGLYLGQEAHYTTASDTPPTAWTETTTRRPYFVLGFSAFHDGSGGGTGATKPANMRGNMQ